MQTPGTKMKSDEETLVVADPIDIRAELSLDGTGSVTVDKDAADPVLEKKADDVVEALVSSEVSDLDAQASSKAAIEQMGQNLQSKAARQSELLKQPVKKLSERSAEGGDVANALIDLKVQVESLDPARFDFEAGWFTRVVGYLPGVGTPVKRYFSKYESAQTVIDAIIKSLELGQEQLRRDNITLKEDQRRMRELTLKLEKAIKLAQLIDQKLEYRLERDIAASDPKHKFISEELLFPLRQRILDLQQQLAVNQQGVLATEIVIRNNNELIRGVNRALNVTISALQVAVTVAMALANQKIVLDKVSALNTTTSELIANTAARLKTQGTEIHKQASSTQLDMEALKSAFADLNIAMEDIAEFRLKALPQMAESIVEMDKLTKQAEKSIQKKEEGNRITPIIPIEID